VLLQQHVGQELLRAIDQASVARPTAYLDCAIEVNDRFIKLILEHATAAERRPGAHLTPFSRPGRTQDLKRFGQQAVSFFKISSQEAQLRHRIEGAP
jgi:hypothetical protein